MVFEQTGIDFTGGGKSLDTVLVGENAKKLGKKLAGMEISRRIIFLETAIGQVNSPEITRNLNILLGKTLSEMASSLGYGACRDRSRAEYIIKAIRAYEEAGFKKGEPNERKRLYGLYNYASNICTRVGMLEGAIEFSKKAHEMGQSVGLINS